MICKICFFNLRVRDLILLITDIKMIRASTIVSDSHVAKCASVSREDFMSGADLVDFLGSENQTNMSDDKLISKSSTCARNCREHRDNISNITYFLLAVSRVSC